MAKIRPTIKSRHIVMSVDRNPYDIKVYNGKNKTNNVLIFPIVHHEGERQFYDLLAPIIKKGYKVIVVSLLNKKDRLLFFNYYFSIFEKILNNLIETKELKKTDNLTLMSFGVGAYLISYFQKNKQLNIKKMILISPVNQYRDEYQISNEISTFEIPTYIHFGQDDNVNLLDIRYRLFEKGRFNQHVHFLSYPICGYFLYYKDILSRRIEALYKKDGYDLFIGESSIYKASALPEEAIYNDVFFEHLFDELDDKPQKKRIVLMSDVFPLFVNGVNMVVVGLRRELQALGYEVYSAALWNKKTTLTAVPDEYYIPIEGSYAYFLRGYKELEMLKTFNFNKYAKQLCLFNFDYIHLHTDYAMSKICLRLSKMTDVKFLYTFHTLWNLYYEHRFGKLIGDITYKAARKIVFNQIYKEAQIITLPSKKSYEIVKNESKDAKDIRIIPTPINPKRFALSKEDEKVVQDLKEQFNLKGQKVLGYIGRVSLEKNILETLDYISKVKSEIPNIRFLIVGVGDAVPSLKKQIKHLHLEDVVTFVGEIENSKLKYYYRLFDVFVTASNFETQGLTYFEAASCNTLILARKDKAIEDIFIDGENAYIYSDFSQWVFKLQRALFSDNKKIIENAKKTVEKYTPQAWAKQIAGIYQELNPEERVLIFKK